MSFDNENHGELTEKEPGLTFKNNYFGPTLPPHLSKKDDFERNKTEKIYGPLLPDHFSGSNIKELSRVSVSGSTENHQMVIGPNLPEHLRNSVAELDSEEEEQDKELIVDSSFGPSINLMVSGDVSVSCKYIGASNIDKKNSNESITKREKWMTELPEKKKGNFGTVSRLFKSRIPTDKESDDSVWTETPADKAKTEKERKSKNYKEILETRRLQERDKQMEKLARKAAKKLRKKESLLEMHVKKMKKKNKKERRKQEKKDDSIPIRRPFDRNIDLQIRKFDENQKRAVINKSQFLNDRFAPGQSKFL